MADHSIKEFISLYGDYLESARKRVYFLALFFVAVSATTLFSSGYIIRFIINFFDLRGVTIVIVSPFQFLDLAVSVAMSSAFLILTPVALWQLHSFLRSAFSKREMRIFFLFLPFSMGLFAVGFLYGFSVMYFGLQNIADLNTFFGLQNMWNVGLFISQLLLTSSLLGVLFELPLILSFLLRFKVISIEQLVSKRRIVYVSIVAIVSFLPPTDGLSLVVMSLPLIVLYELVVVWGKIRARVV